METGGKIMASADPRSPDFDPRLLRNTDVDAPQKKQSFIEHLVETFSPESLLQSAKTSAIHTAQIAPLLIGGPTGGLLKSALASGGITSVSKGIEDILKGQPQNAPIDMLKSGVISTGTSGGLGLIGKGLGFIVKGMLKGNLNDKYSEPVVEKVLNNVKLTAPSKKSYGEIEAKTQKSVKGLLDEYGQAVGAAKKEAIKSESTINPLNTKFAITSLATKKKIPVGVPVKGKPSTEEGIDTLKNVLDELGDSPKMNIEDATTTLKNIDSELGRVYQKQATPGARLSEAEKYALQVRGKLNSQINNKIEPALGDAKGKYSALKGLLDENRGELAKKLTNPDFTYQVLNQALKESDKPMLQRLTEIDAMLPDGEKFLDDAIQKIVSSRLVEKGELGIEKGIYNLMNYPLRKSVPIAATGLRSAPQISGIKEILSRLAGTIGGNQ